MMRGLSLPDPAMAGKFRGEEGLEDIGVRVNSLAGVAPEDMSAALFEFEWEFKKGIARLDRMIPIGGELDAARLAEVLRLCAWAHCEWVRIHPFANGNGRVARLLANSVAMRYGLPDFVNLRPRPGGDYGAASASAMRGDWHPMVIVFKRMLDDSLV